MKGSGRELGCGKGEQSGRIPFTADNDIGCFKHYCIIAASGAAVLVLRPQGAALSACLDVVRAPAPVVDLNCKLRVLLGLGQRGQVELCINR